ncbi:MAG: hypothetical protein PHF46_01890 [Candidatus Gracilibacteria bacterium]|nr:hypothetical protein [Candidatus Gracilibacteria bacterium]MDD3120137.1 hypothetical protein [Candidatus Gracilibacteria bacterium]MDD4530133.1 hypothetical protein [Candidatus Gracilibacteria bacterium]
MGQILSMDRYHPKNINSENSFVHFFEIQKTVKTAVAKKIQSKQNEPEEKGLEEHIIEDDKNSMTMLDEKYMTHLENIVKTSPSENALKKLLFDKFGNINGFDYEKSFEFVVYIAYMFDYYKDIKDFKTFETFIKNLSEQGIFFTEQFIKYGNDFFVALGAVFMFSRSAFEYSDNKFKLLKNIRKILEQEKFLIRKGELETIKGIIENRIGFGSKNIYLYILNCLRLGKLNLQETQYFYPISNLN